MIFEQFWALLKLLSTYNNVQNINNIQTVCLLYLLTNIVNYLVQFVREFWFHIFCINESEIKFLKYIINIEQSELITKQAELIKIIMFMIVL